MERLNKAVRGVLSKWLERTPSVGVGRVRSACTEVGAGLVVEGFPHLENRGTLRLGKSVRIVSRFVPTRLRVGPGAVLDIGDGTTIGYGAVISASDRIRIGAGVKIGPYVFIVDANVGDPDMGTEHSNAAPITIGDGVTLEIHVAVLKGSTIGDGARVTAGSVVAGEIPPHTVARGNPARVVGLSRPRLLHETLHCAAAAFPARPALICGDRTVTHHELLNRVRRLSTSMRNEAQVKTGDKVLLLFTSKIDFVVTFYACALIGAVAIPMPSDATRVTVMDIAEASRANVICTDGSTLDELSSLLSNLYVLRVVATPSDLFEREGETHNRDLDSLFPLDGSPREQHDAAVIMFTSGTTAKAKLIELSHRSLLQATDNMNEFMRLDCHVREYVTVPLYHSFGLGRVRAVLAVGGTLIVDDGPMNPATIVSAIKRNRCNALSAVPAGLALFKGPMQAELRRIGRQTSRRLAHHEPARVEESKFSLRHDADHGLRCRGL